MTTETSRERPRFSDLHVVGIGASAGGLEALERFFQALPGDLDAAYVVVQHLSPDFKSHMHELLGRRTSMSVRRVRNGMVVRPNVIYLLPPKKEMILSGGKLLLTEKAEGLSHPIDVFFRSIAQDLGQRSIAIVLSGTGSDGSRGIRDIHEAGGLVLCQSEDSASFDGMPLAAQATGAVDLVVAPEEMPAALAKYLGKASPEEEEELGEDPALRGLDKALHLLRLEHGIDFAQYKKATVLRRVHRRVTLSELDLDEYLQRLENDAGERAALYRDLLIGVTRFFRDLDVFEFLDREVVPEVVARAKVGQPVRGWVAGCATGEEAYSIAMLFREHFLRSSKDLTLKLFATDVHRRSLEIASAGVYSEDALSEVTPERRRAHFIECKEGWQVAKELRQMIIFAPHNLLQDAPFTNLDFVTCRNFLIYLQPLAQKKTLSLFHFGLKTSGVLVLGPSETPRELESEFDPLDSHWRIYRKRRDVRLPLQSRMAPVGKSQRAPALRQNAGSQPPDGSVPLLPVYDRLLEQYAPKSLLIDEQFHLLHAFGGAEALLRIPRGRYTRDVRTLVDEKLKTALSGAVQHALGQRRPVKYTGLKLPTGETCSLAVEPFSIPRLAMPTLLVRFEPAEVEAPRPTAAVELDLDDVSRDRMENLENELRLTQENLQATIEELETANEELQATNEELVTSNEELQSTNEELHSVNEELYSVNTEHQRKIEELTRLTDDMNNLLATTEVGVMFLDRDLSIRKFTPRIGEFFHLVSRDVGRRVDSFAHTLRYDGLMDDLERSMAEEARLEREVTDHTGRRHLLRILPYRTKGKVDGVVLTLIDIEAVKAAQGELQRLSAIVASSEEAIIGKDLDGVIQSWNRGAERIYGFSEEEAVGRSISMLFPPERKGDLDGILERIRNGEVLEGLEVERIHKDGRRLQIRLTLSPVRNEEGEIVGASAIGHDITERKLAEQALAESERRLRFALEAGNMGTWELDLAAGRAWIDESLCELCGLAPDSSEVEFSAWLECVHPRDRDRVRRAVDEAAQGDGSYVSEFRVVLPDGRVRWLAGRGGVSDDGSSGGLRMVGVNFDITPTKQAERRLATIHAVTQVLASAKTWEAAVPEILAALCASLPGEICEMWMREDSGRWVCVEAHSTLGEETPEAFAKRGAVLGPGEGLPGRVVSSREPVWLQEASSSDSAPEFRTAVGFPIFAGGTVDAVVTCFSEELQTEDETLTEMLGGLGRQLGEFRRRTDAERARRQSDERLRKTLDTLLPFVGLCQPDGTVVEVNRSLLEAAHLDASEVVGKPFDETYWFSWSEDVQQQLRQAIRRAAEGMPSRYDVDIRTGDAAFVTLDFQIVPMLDDSGAVSYLVPSGIDVTARRAAERRLLEVNDELERRVVERTEKLQRRTAMLQHLSRQLARVEQNERKRLARILHDHLQQLIAAAKIRLDLLEHDLKEGPSRDHLESARDTLEEAVRASRTLAAELSPPILDTATLPEALKWLVRWVYENHRLSVTFVEEPIPAISEDTKIFLFQSARELIFNVVKHARAQTCKLRLSGAGSRRVQLEIADDGRGFDPDSLSKVEATGLGLLSIQERVEGLGGEFELRARPNEGVRIRISAPALADETRSSSRRPPVRDATGVRRATARTASSNGDVRVLVVDDHRIVREGLASILSSQEGIEVVGEAQDGQEALDLAIAIEPDVILMDVDLPGISGIEATRLIKERLPDVQLIGLSIHEEREVVNSMRGAGACDFLTKGGHPEHLFRRILEVVGASRA